MTLSFNGVTIVSGTGYSGFRFVAETSVPELSFVGDADVYFLDDPATVYSAGITVLVDHGSESAAEAFAVSRPLAMAGIGALVVSGGPTMDRARCVTCDCRITGCTTTTSYLFRGSAHEV